MMGKNLSKAHFEAVAAVFRHADLQAATCYEDSREMSQGMECMRLILATALATVYERANPLFDRTKFLLACGANRDAAEA